MELYTKKYWVIQLLTLLASTVVEQHHKSYLFKETKKH